MTTTNLVPDLNTILAAKRHSLEIRKRQTPLTAIRALASMQKRPVPFLNTVTNNDAPLLIGHIRYVSLQNPDQIYDPVAQAIRYARMGINALALFTDSAIYNGGLDDLVFVAQALQSFNLPVITMDYITDEYQICEARAAGASGVMITAAIHDFDSLRALVSSTQRNRMTPIISVSNEEELNWALDISPQAISLSNYDAKTGEYNPDMPDKLRPLIPRHINVIMGGGIHSREHLEHVAKLHIDALLISENLLTTLNINTIQMLLTNENSS